MNNKTRVLLVSLSLVTAPAHAGWWSKPGKDEEITREQMKGDPGEKGATGATGATGAAGAAGAAGAEGPRGKDGAWQKDSRGATGKTGPRGTDGSDGKDGANGLRGKDGIDGVNGFDDVYAREYRHTDLLSALAVNSAVANIPAPLHCGNCANTSIGIGYGTYGGKHAGAIGLHYNEDAISYKITVGISRNEQTAGVGVGFSF